MNPQSGSILMIMLLVLIMGGSLFLYAALNQSSQQMKFDQTQNQLQQLNEIKQRLILFAFDNDIFCTLEERKHHLPSELNSDAFGFNDLTFINHIQLSFKTNEEELPTVSCNGVIKAVPVCDFDYEEDQQHVATLRFKSQDTPAVKVYKKEVGC